MRSTGREIPARSGNESAGGSRGADAADLSSREASRDDALRRSRREAFEARFESNRLAMAGAIVSLAFLLQPSLVIRGVMLVLFIAATLVSGKRIPVPTTILVASTIVLANLLLPLGRVLFRVGPLVVTEGALLGGIGKAVTFEGLMFVSRTAIRSDLRLPGRFGSIVSRAFLYYDRIVEYRGRISPATFLADADELMLSIWESGEGVAGRADGGGAAVDPAGAPADALSAGPGAQRSHTGTPALLALCAAAWLALLL